MKCEQCKAEMLDENSKYCSSCGKDQTMAMDVQNAVNPQVVVNSNDGQPKPSVTAQIVLSAINIMCCGSTIFGIIALVFALLATSEKDYEEATKKIRIAMILNIVGLVLAFVSIIAIVLIFVFSAIISASAGDFMTYTY